MNLLYWLTLQFCDTDSELSQALTATILDP